jgi:hypothetical protein
MTQPDNIQPLEWLSASGVLGHEASVFTPWLSRNLDLLGSALGLTELVLERTEQSVQGKSLDILATGTDQDDNEFPVLIENQYGETNHRHLGQLITYMAQYERGYAVWVTEDAHPAHVAAIDYLNRTSPEDVNYFLVRARFTHGPQGTHQVYFELLAKPNIFTKETKARRRVAGHRAPNAARRDYLADVLSRCSGELASAGYTNIRMHTHGSYIEARVPVPALDEWGARFKIYVTKTQTIARFHFYDFPTRQQNAAAVDVLRDRHEREWERELPDVPEYEWHGGAAGAVSDYFAVALAGQGYEGGDATTSAAWAARIAGVWLESLQRDRLENLEQFVEERLDDVDTAVDLAEQ